MADAATRTVPPPRAARRPAGTAAHPYLGRLRLSLPGAVVATALLCLSCTPSLLPRTWLVQGILGGLTAATGYGIGVAGGWLTRGKLPAGARRWALRAYAVAAPVAVPLLVYLGWRWQVQICGVLRVRPPSAWSWSLVLPVAGAVFAVVLGAARLLRHAAYRAAGLLGRRRSRLIAAALVVLGFLAHGTLAGWLLRGADRASERLTGPAPGLTAPADATRSGGPGSYVPWSSLDKQGRSFVVGAPSPDDLQRAGGRAPGRPVRVYVGLRTAPDDDARARLAVRELERTGAASRKVVCIVVPTGSGWVDEPTIRALEYRYAGDTALVAVQYSAMPSWLSFLAAPDQARDAATRVLAEVHRWWSGLPAGSRPQLLIYGHSLGAVGARAAMTGPAGRVDGALISGLPDGNSLVGPATSFRTVYLAHPTDPVAWWSPRLIVRRPDWLRGRPGADGRPAVHWFPVVTFWQLSADMLAALNVPAGYGHSYDAEAAGAWAAVTP